ncbi:MAG: Gfo/Idh/MocA family oxidoreductase [Bergeyella zoohelcum]|nr:Gfo/Idh/MocA family oxidoreductase [Bergeyella zoohelcum]
MTKFAILGLGFMGKKHLDAISQNPNAMVSAIIDEQPISIPDTKYFSCLDFFLAESTDTDVVIISTPNCQHFSEAKKLLENGYNILLEKPYCLTTEEAEILKDTAEKHKKNIFFSHQNRYSEISKFLKKICDDALLGEIYFIQSNLFWNRGENYYLPQSWKGKKAQDGGVLYTQFFHFIDLIIWLFGDIHIRSTMMKTLRNQTIVEIEDTGSFSFELMKGNGMGVVNFSTAVYEKNLESSMTILAENGTIKISGQYFDNIEFCNIKNFDFKELTQNNNLTNLSQMIDEICQSHSQYPTTNLEENLQIVKRIEEIYTKTN